MSTCILVMLLLGACAYADDTGKTTRYWDCCKVSCSWNGKNAYASGSGPVQACQKDGVTKIDKDAKSACEGGPSYICNSNQPFEVDDNLAYGFAAASVQGKAESESCCACYDLKFTSTAIAGKRMVVQSINTGGDLGHNHFDIQIPGGGVGIFKKGCSSQWGVSEDGWGKVYGGVSSVSECSSLPSQLQAGCNFRFGWYKNTDNPAMEFKRVKCPKAITDITHCIRADDNNYPAAPGAGSASAPIPAPSVPAPAPASASGSTSSCPNGAYQQCGGDGFGGKKCCQSGMYCKVENQWYSQCRPGSGEGSAAPAPAPSPVPSPAPAPPSSGCSVELYQKCGGDSGCCKDGKKCTFINQWHSQCE